MIQVGLKSGVGSGEKTTAGFLSVVMKVIIRRVNERYGLMVIIISPSSPPVASGVCVRISGRSNEKVMAGIGAIRAGTPMSAVGAAVVRGATVSVAVELDTWVVL